MASNHLVGGSNPSRPAILIMNKNENLFDATTNEIYRPWMRTIYFVIGILIILLSCIILYIAHVKHQSVMGYALSGILFLTGTSTIIFTRKASDKLVSFMFSGWRSL